MSQIVRAETVAVEETEQARMEREEKERQEREREERERKEDQEWREWRGRVKAAAGRLYPVWLPRGELTLLVGDPGTGKSLVALDLAARLGVGRVVDPLGAELGVPGGDGTGGYVGPEGERLGGGTALFFSAEESEETVAARIEAAGGAGNVYYGAGKETDLVPVKKKEVREEGGNVWRDGPVWGKKRRSEEIRVGEAPLVRYLRERGEGLGAPDIRLVVLDPLPAFLGGFGCGSGMKVREALVPLVGLARQQEFAVLGVMHLNKGTGRNMLYRAVGSLAYTALARSVLAVSAEGNGRRVMVPVKCNGGAVRHGWGFRIVERGAAAGVEWAREAVREHELLGPGDGVSRREARQAEEEALAESQMEFAEEFLREELKDGEKETMRVMRRARRLGIAQRTLERARKMMGVRCWYDGVGKRWVMGDGKRET